jgi:hypothetical protein
MNTITQSDTPIAQRMHLLARNFVRSAGGALGAILRPAFRLRLTTAFGAVAIAATSMLSPQSAAAATTYTVNVRFHSVNFWNVDDGVIYTGWFNYTTDTEMEVYGYFDAYTPAGAASAGWFPYRNFGTWGSNPSGCPASGVLWDSSTGATCVKWTPWDNVHFWNATTENLSNLLLCSSVNYTSCGTGYSKGNNVIKLQVHAGETIHVGAHMKDRDWGSSDDEVCTNAVNLGPFTDAQLQYINESHSLWMSDNGNAQCRVDYSLTYY